MIYKDLISGVTIKKEFDQVAFFSIYLSEYFFDENNVAELVADNDEAAIRRCSSKYVLLNISHISQENTCT